MPASFRMDSSLGTRSFSTCCAKVPSVCGAGAAPPEAWHRNTTHLEMPVRRLALAVLIFSGFPGYMPTWQNPRDLQVQGTSDGRTP